MIGRIDQQSWGEGTQRQYKTVLVATEIVLVSFAVPKEALAGVVPEADQPALNAPEPVPTVL